MVDKSISMNINETLELDYLVEDSSKDIINITGEPNNANSSINYVKKHFGIFNPPEVGTYTLDIKGQIIEINVTDIPESGIARWTFDDSDTDSGTTIDSWGNNDGTINGATTGVTGANQTYPTDQGYEFDGSNNYIIIGDNESFEGLTEISVSIWVNYDNVTDEQYTICKAETGINNTWQIKVMSGEFRSAFWDTSGNPYGPNGGNLSTNQWYHVVATYGSSESVLYINGNRISSDPTSGNNLRNTSSRVAIGSTGNPGLYSNAILDDPRVYSKKLTDSEVSNLYNSGYIG
jgi:hypothetical protein